MISPCKCIGCIRNDCGLCDPCRESNGDRCLLRRCQSFAYSPESQEKWQRDVKYLFRNDPHLIRLYVPETVPITPVKHNHHPSPPILPQLISSLYGDVHRRPPPNRVNCGKCSTCQACQLCPNCCNPQPSKCPLLACEKISYSIAAIEAMERKARRAVSSNPTQLTPLYESMYGKDGFMTRQKRERQKEKETIYTNMFGERDDTERRQIMLRSKFPRNVVSPDVVSTCNVATRKRDDSSKMALSKQKKAANKTRKQKTCGTCKRCQLVAKCAPYPNIHGLCIECSRMGTYTNKAGSNEKADTNMRPNTKRQKDNESAFTTDQQSEKEFDDEFEPRQRRLRSRLFRKRLFAEEDHSLSNDSSALSFGQTPHVPCERCRIVTVCGLCTDCNRIENIHRMGRFFQSRQANHSAASSRAELIKSIQSSLKHVVQSMGSKQRKLKVQFADSSYKYMEWLWRERDHPYLFGDRISQQPNSFLAGIDASPCLDDQDSEEDNCRANDGGGPTRQFLSMFWRYLPKITLMDMSNNTYRLFEETTNFLQPLCDDKIHRLREEYFELEESHIFRCYRALGRIIGCCILHHYHISNNVLSKIHRNYLLRGISPKDRYDISDLFYDLKECMSQQTKENEEVFDDLGALLDCESNNETEFEKKLRDFAYEVYIEQNMIFLEAVKEGMQLDFLAATAIPEIFQPVHSSLLDELLFGRTTFDVEDLIAALQPVYADENKQPCSPMTKARVEIQKQVLRKNDMRSKAEGAFVNVLRTLSRKNKEFLTSFVLYVTGYEYLPVAQTIKIEFNYDQVPSNDALPVAHTCVHTLKLPGLAYDANEDLIKEKLCMSLKYFKDSESEFNMT